MIASRAFINTGGIVPVRIDVAKDVTLDHCEIASPRGAGGESRVILKSSDL